MGEIVSALRPLPMWRLALSPGVGEGIVHWTRHCEASRLPGPAILTNDAGAPW